MFSSNFANVKTHLNKIVKILRFNQIRFSGLNKKFNTNGLHLKWNLSVNVPEI